MVSGLQARFEKLTKKQWWTNVGPILDQFCLLLARTLLRSASPRCGVSLAWCVPILIPILVLVSVLVRMLVLILVLVPILVLVLVRSCSPLGHAPGLGFSDETRRRVAYHVVGHILERQVIVAPDHAGPAPWRARSRVCQCWTTTIGSARSVEGSDRGARREAIHRPS